MKKNEDRKKARQMVERKIWTIAVLIFVSTICLGYGGVMYAKYYSQGYEKGVAVASAIYFSANHAFESEGNFVQSLVVPTESGDGYEFVFEVRNYENNLLFNDSSVDIPYEISFWLAQASEEGVRHTVTYNGESKDIPVYSYDEENDVYTGDKLIYTGHSIIGGAAKANEYKIVVSGITNKAEHIKIPIYVEVNTTDASPVTKTLRGEIVFNGGIMGTSFIETQQFVTKTQNTNDKYEEIKKQSALKYEIRTVGAVTSGNTQKIMLSWDSKVFDIDLFDIVYNKWLTENEKTEPEKVLNDAGEWNGWYYITIDAMPYSSEIVTFFRGSEFSTKVTDIGTLYEYIEAEMK